MCENADSTFPLSYYVDFPLLVPHVPNAGEELLIDYGSGDKGMYRFVRTYGFISNNSCRKTAHHTVSNNHPTMDNLRVHVELEQSRQPVDNSISRDSYSGGVFSNEKPMTENERLPTKKANVDIWSLPVDISIVDAILAKISRRSLLQHSPSSAADKSLNQGAGLKENATNVDFSSQFPLLENNGVLDDIRNRPLPTRVEHGNHDTIPAPGLTGALRLAVTEMLGRYATSLEEDLRILKNYSEECIEPTAVGDGVLRREKKRNIIKGATGVGDNSCGRLVDTQWEQTCIRIRAAEKVALLSALRREELVDEAC